MKRAKPSTPSSWRNTRVTLLALVAVCLLGFGCGPKTGVIGFSKPPNVVLILADDLDARLLQEHSANYPNLRKLADQGTTFENTFITDPLCCPSRATILRGQYAHNHGIVGNWWPRGGSQKFRELGHEDSTVATWLQEEGYRTVLIGKYMNDYSGERVPVGWDDWHSIAGNYLSEDLNENGRIRHYDPKRYHLDDVLAQKATGYVRGAEGDAGGEAPFFMWVGTKAPHAPATPAPRHEEAFSDARLPRGSSFNEEDVSDKPDWVRDNPPLGHKEVEPMQELYGDRLRSMLAVDEMVGDLVKALKQSGELENTFIFFTSDNGWHAGEHRLSTGKWTAYEEDVRVPLIVRGPGVAEGAKLPQLVLNNDLAPTFADLAGAKAPPFVDGRSLKPLLMNDPPTTREWRTALLVEAATEVGFPPIPPLSGDYVPQEEQRAPQEGWGRPGLEAVRTERHLYVEYGNGERELYDLREDPYQLHNQYKTADPERLRGLRERLGALRGCSGAGCHAAEEGE